RRRCGASSGRLLGDHSSQHRRCFPIRVRNNRTNMSRETLLGLVGCRPCAVAVSFLLALSALAPPGWSAPAPQQTATEPVRTAAVNETSDQIVVDGALDEAAWRQAPTIGDLIQRIPNAGA